jgi:hypothetical protein
MNALTKAAINRVEANCKCTKIQNYTIAVVCGIALGVMFGLGV